QRGCSAVVTDPETLEPQDPGDGALHDPAVPAQVGLGLDSAPGDPDLDASPVQVAAAPRVVVAPVRVPLLRPAAGPPRTPSDRQRGCSAAGPDPETLEPQDPGDGALLDPAVPAQVGLGLDSAPGDPDLDASPVQVAAAPRVVVALVRVQLLRPAAGPPRTP